MWRGAGVAVGMEKGGRVATCAEVRADGAGHMSVVRIVTAYECGAAVNPDTVLSQIEGGTVMAIGGTLFESVAFDYGQIASPSLSGYRVPHFTDVPELDVVLIDRPDLPSAGAGETPLIAVAPAIANAIFAATGGSYLLSHSGMRNHTLPERHAVVPVRLGVREPHVVAERDAHIRVQPVVSRQPSRQRSRQQCEGERAHCRRRHRDESDRAVGRRRGR